MLAQIVFGGPAPVGLVQGYMPSCNGIVGAIDYMIDKFVPPASSSSLRFSQRVMAKIEALYAFVYVFVQCGVLCLLNCVTRVRAFKSSGVTAW